MRTWDDSATRTTEGEGGRRQAPVGEARPQGRAVVARAPRSLTRSIRCARCQELRDPQGLLTMADVAFRLGTSVRHVQRLVTERRIPIVKVGRFVRFDEHEVEHWIDDHRVTPGPSGSSLRRGR
jgi:excisionase family DNA binding protein